MFYQQSWHQLARRLLQTVIFSFGFMQAPVLLAESVPETVSVAPDALIQKATDEIIVAIEEAKDYFSEDPARFHAEIDRILFPIVDFRSFARGVMGKYGSRRYEASLGDQAAKDEFRKQVKRFTANFKQGLVATYAKGLLTFQGESIEVMPLAKEAVPGKNAIVVQSIEADGKKPTLIRYKMRQNSNGEWKVRNVTLSSVNLGKVYSNQFASAAKLYNGDIDKVIANWVVESQEIDE